VGRLVWTHRRVLAACGPNSPFDGNRRVGLGYRFSQGGRCRTHAGPALREALEKQEVWLWLNFDLADEGASATIAALPHLPPALWRC